MSNQARCVLITGASSGIGRQLALDYAQQGWRVYACGRNQDKLFELTTEADIMTLCFDVTSEHETQQALANLQPLPSLWILNAGDCEYIDDGQIDAAVIKRVMTVNVFGVANCIAAVQKDFQPGHKIAIVGSIASEVALPRAEAYGASKAAVSYFARSLRLALRQQQVSVVSIYPGFVATPLTDKNTFPMPMMVTVEEASNSIRSGLSTNKQQIYFPAGFTWALRLIGLLPYYWQAKLVARLIKN
ncbi:short-chain dehydrogenase [Vibrio sp. 10N.286.49.B3]|uniref:SDR family NAD(P)-dependent oxidoreductase n=1 Tax=Vibrio sp. 10N.286.49.B3 TaxID=1880855 RepID=UPI000C82E155|nr:SDR family NAD(P)-dependent oxidoreductase [Vibrio sp. 10N.286.49.B3]PMH46764.1 short-chain dehydrogenase [Vibrio sp. 10N.286.49.B3]